MTEVPTTLDCPTVRGARIVRGAGLDLPGIQEQDLTVRSEDDLLGPGGFPAEEA